MTESDYSRIQTSYSTTMRELGAPNVAATVLTLVRVIEREQLSLKPATDVHNRLVECISNVHSAKYRDGLAFAAMLQHRNGRF
jgi:hypothetical protein